MRAHSLPSNSLTTHSMDDWLNMAAQCDQSWSRSACILIKQTTTKAISSFCHLTLSLEQKFTMDHWIRVQGMAPIFPGQKSFIFGKIKKSIHCYVLLLSGKTTHNHCHFVPGNDPCELYCFGFDKIGQLQSKTAFIQPRASVLEKE